VEKEKEMNGIKKSFIIVLVLVASLAVELLLSPFSIADEIIKGHYCYTYGDNESLREAKDLTRTLAIRNAIESYRTFVKSTSNVKNFQLTNDIIQMISSGYLKNVRVLDHTEKGRTICETIQASVSPQAIDNVIKREVRKRTKKVEHIGLDNNGYLKVLKVKKQKDSRWLNVIVKVLRRTGPLFLSNEQNMKPYFRVCIDYYDSDGDPVGGESNFIHESTTEAIPGQIKVVKFFAPIDAVTYRVWLPKQ
jgi:hypothetical protein